MCGTIGCRCRSGPLIHRNTISIQVACGSFFDNGLFRCFGNYMLLVHDLGSWYWPRFDRTVWFCRRSVSHVSLYGSWWQVWQTTVSSRRLGRCTWNECLWGNGHASSLSFWRVSVGRQRSLSCHPIRCCFGFRSLAALVARFRGCVAIVARHIDVSSQRQKPGFVFWRANA